MAALTVLPKQVSHQWTDQTRRIITVGLLVKVIPVDRSLALVFLILRQLRHPFIIVLLEHLVAVKRLVT